jgi:hypothetical protein
MTTLLEEAVEEVRALPEDERKEHLRRAIVLARERSEYSFDAEHIASQGVSPVLKEQTPRFM